MSSNQVPGYVMMWDTGTSTSTATTYITDGTWQAAYSTPPVKPKRRCKVLQDDGGRVAWWEKRELGEFEPLPEGAIELMGF